VPSFPETGFPSIDGIMQLVRSIVNDTFPGIANQQGRIFTNDAPFTIPLLNSAFRKLQRRLRNEGVTFPIKDNVILANMTPIVQADPNVQVSIGFEGYFDGTTTHATPKLPSDLMQPYRLWEQTAGTNVPFMPMTQPQQGLPASFQGQWLGFWEWRNYHIYMIGSLQTKNLRIRYQSGQPPLNVPASQFASTNVNILDCDDAIANLMAEMYGRRNGADPESIKGVRADADEAIDEMVQEYVRRSQTVNYRRPPYNGGGSNDGNDGDGIVGQSGWGA
jgi:hypothetical protein